MLSRRSIKADWLRKVADAMPRASPSRSRRGQTAQARTMPLELLQVVEHGLVKIGIPADVGESKRDRPRPGGDQDEFAITQSRQGGVRCAQHERDLRFRVNDEEIKASVR